MASSPSKYLLYQAAVKLFGLNTAAMAEPISATFARGIVDGNNNLVLTPAQLVALAALLAGGGGSSNTTGKVTIGNGADSVQVTGLGLSSVPNGCIVTVMKPSSGEYNLFATVDLSSLSTDGFTAHLSAATDTGTYVLTYLLF